MSGKYQVMPPLTRMEIDRLTASIREDGVKVPVITDEDGEIIDGHHRAMIADSLGIDYPRDIWPGLAEYEKRIWAAKLNQDRRQLTDAQMIVLGKQIEPDIAEQARARMAEAGKKSSPGKGGTDVPPFPPQRSRDDVAKAVGLGSGRTYERGKDLLAQVEQEPDGATLMAEIKQGNWTLRDAKQELTRRHGKDAVSGTVKRRKIPRDDLAVIQARIAAGESHRQIAADYGVVPSAVRNYLKAATRWDEPPPSRRMFTDEEEAEIEAKYRAGQTQRALQAAYGCGQGTIGLVIKRVRARRKEAGVATPPVAEAAPNVVAFTPRRDAPPKARPRAVDIQRTAMGLADECRRLEDVLNGLDAQFGEDLIPALIGSAEGEVIAAKCRAMASRLDAIATALAQKGQQRHDSTGS